MEEASNYGVGLILDLGIADGHEPHGGCRKSGTLIQGCLMEVTGKLNSKLGAATRGAGISHLVGPLAHVVGGLEARCVEAVPRGGDR